MSFNEMAVKFNTMKEQMVAEAKEAVYAEFKNIFALYPELTVIKWTQYTPYFNDGEECTFSVNDLVVSNAPDIENVAAYGDYEGDADDVFVEYGHRCKYIEVVDISKFATSTLGEEIFRGAFGNHVTVIVTRDGIEVEEYDHD